MRRVIQLGDHPVYSERGLETVLSSQQTVQPVVAWLVQLERDIIDSSFMPWFSCLPGVRLWLQSDNTIKEVKNGLSGVVMAALVSCRYFDECGHHHLPVGHTHEDIGL